MNALYEWRHYLLGARQRFEIWTDHQNLQYFKLPQKLNRRQARWLTELADYEFELHHVPGGKMGKADALSRRAGHERGVMDNKDVVLLKPEFFIQAIELGEEEPRGDIFEKIKKRKTHKDRYVVVALEKGEKEWREEDGVIY